MPTLTFEQLRIGLTLTFDNLVEPVQIIKKGKVVGYIVKDITGVKQDPEPCQDCKAEYARGLEEGKKQATLSMPAPEIVAPGRSCEPVFVTSPPVLSEIPIQRPSYACNFFNPQPKSTKPDKPGRYVPAATRAPTVKAVALPESSGLVTHSPTCTCALCKPTHIHKDISSIVDKASALPTPVNSKPKHPRTHARKERKQ